MRYIYLATFLLTVAASPALSGETVGKSAEFSCHVGKSAVWVPGGYLLRNGCHACEKVGSAVFAFDFDTGGTFLGTRLMMVTDTTQGKYSDPSLPVKVNAGGEFSLKLASNPTTGYRWNLTEPPDTAVVMFSGNQYRSSTQGRLGSGGVDTWTFKAVGKGRALIFLRYARSWEKDVEPIRQAVFVVEVR
jgi:predicted secreted protein